MTSARLGGVRRDVADLGRSVPLHQGRGRRRRLARVPVLRACAMAAAVLLALAWQAGVLGQLRGALALDRGLRAGRDRAAVPADRRRRAVRVLVAGGDPDRLRAADRGAARDPLRRGRAGHRASAWSACWSASPGVVALVGIDVAGRRRADGTGSRARPVAVLRRRRWSSSEAPGHRRAGARWAPPCRSRRCCWRSRRRSRRRARCRRPTRSVSIVGARPGLHGARAFVVFSVLIREVGPGRGAGHHLRQPGRRGRARRAILGERPGAGAVAGLLLILAGSWLSTDGPAAAGARPARARVRRVARTARRTSHLASRPSR